MVESSREALGSAVLIVMVFLNVIASLLILFLIGFMRRNGTLTVNLYIKCVIWMTFYQILSDYCLEPLNKHCYEHNNPLECAISTAGNTVGGYGSAIWSLMLVVAAAFTVEMGRKPTYREEITAFVLVSVMLCLHVPFLTLSAYYSATNPQAFHHQFKIYNIARMVLIVISILVISRMYYVLLKVSVAGQRELSPIYHLLRKIVYYPIVQCVCRISIMAYVWGYNGNLYFSGFGGWQTFWLYIVFITLPSCGIGDFLVFLQIQKGATTELKRMVCLNFSVVPTTEKQETGKQYRNKKSKNKSLSARKDNDKCEGLSTLEEGEEEEHEKQNTDGDAWHQATKSTSPNTVDYDYDYNAIKSRIYAMDEDELLDEYFLNRSSQSGQSFGAVQSAGLSASLSKASDGTVPTPLSASIVEFRAFEKTRTEFSCDIIPPPTKISGRMEDG